MKILVGAVVLILNNTTIIDTAEESVYKTNEVSINEFDQTVWEEAYLNTARTQEKL